MEPPAHANVAVIRSYLKALEPGRPAAELERFLAADVEQVELPSRLNPNGKTSDRATLLARIEQGRGLVRSQSYDVLNVVATGDDVAVEARWSGTRVDGRSLVAHIAMFFTLRDGLIHPQRNYDCFEPF